MECIGTFTDQSLTDYEKKNKKTAFPFKITQQVAKEKISDQWTNSCEILRIYLFLGKKGFSVMNWQVKSGHFFFCPQNEAIQVWT